MRTAHRMASHDGDDLVRHMEKRSLGGHLRGFARSRSRPGASPIRPPAFVHMRRRSFSKNARAAAPRSAKPCSCTRRAARPARPSLRTSRSRVKMGPRSQSVPRGRVNDLGGTLWRIDLTSGGVVTRAGNGRRTRWKPDRRSAAPRGSARALWDERRRHETQHTHRCRKRLGEPHDYDQLNATGEVRRFTSATTKRPQGINRRA